MTFIIIGTVAVVTIGIRFIARAAARMEEAHYL